MSYLSLEKAFEVIIRRTGDSESVLNPIKDAMKKFGYSIIEKEPIQKKDCIHFKCDICNFEGEQQYKNLIKYKPKCNCVIDNSKKVTTNSDIISIKKYKLLFEKSNIILAPEQVYKDKRITSEFKYKCRNCDYSFTMTLDELADYIKKFTGHKGCENCAKNDTQVYLSLDDAFKIIFTRENRDDVIGPITEAMKKYNFSIVQIEPIQTKEKIQYMCNNCQHKGMSSYYTLLRKGNCRKCNGHTGGGTKPTVVNSFQDILNIAEYKKLFDNTNFILPDKNFDTSKTISSTFYFQCKECDYELGPNLLSYITTCLKNNPETKGCVGCKKKNTVKVDDRCKCGNIVKFCVNCGGSGLCGHGMNKYACSICRPLGRYCKHNIIKCNCKICGKKFYCEHDVLRYRCKHCNFNNYILHLLRCQINKPTRLQYIKKKKHTYEYLNCTVPQLYNVFNKYYNVKMSSEYHIDHIKPLSRFDFTIEGELEKALHWTNLQPLLKHDNLKKYNKWSDELDIWWNNEIQHKLDLFPMDKQNINDDSSNDIIADEFLDMVHDIITDENSNLYNYVKIIQNECNRKFIEYTSDGYIFECNVCKNRKAIVNVQQLAINKNECGSCVQLKNKYTFDDIENFVKKSDLKLEMTKDEYVSADKIKVSCKHGIVMTKTLRNIKDNKGCAVLCKEEKRLARKKLKKMMECNM